MARKKTDAEIVAENNRILDEVDAMDPNDPSLAPFKTKNWIDKGRGMLQGLKPIAVLALVVLLAGCLGRGNAVNLHELRVLDELRETNYRLEQQRDTRHPVEIARPDIWNRLMHPEGRP